MTNIVFTPDQPTIKEVAKKINLDKTTKRDIFNIVAETVRPVNPIRHAHGLNGFDCCLYCEEEINDKNPGKLVIMGNRQEHVCDLCYGEKNYQRIIKEIGAKVKNYNL